MDDSFLYSKIFFDKYQSEWPVIGYMIFLPFDYNDARE